MNEEETQMVESNLREARISAEAEEVRNMHIEQENKQMERSMLAEQLDLTEEKREIWFHLKGYVLELDEPTGELVWTKDPTHDLSFLTEQGINYCFWMLSGYLNKNILLGNYDDEQILASVHDSAQTINDTLFAKSNIYFKEPTLKECQEEIQNNIKKKVDLRKFARRLIGKETDEKEVEREVIAEMEKTIEEELEKIKIKQMNQRYRMMNSLVIYMMHQIAGAYQRAWKGQERKTLRERIHITETKGGMMPQPQKEKGIFDRFR